MGHLSTLEKVTKLLKRSAYIGEQEESRDSERLEWEENLEIDKQRPTMAERDGDRPHVLQTLRQDD